MRPTMKQIIDYTINWHKHCIFILLDISISPIFTMIITTLYSRILERTLIDYFTRKRTLTYNSQPTILRKNGLAYSCSIRACNTRALLWNYECNSMFFKPICHGLLSSSENMRVSVVFRKITLRLHADRAFMGRSSSEMVMCSQLVIMCELSSASIREKRGIS